MKKRKQIFRLLDDYSTKEKFPKEVIRGSCTGLVLYEGNLFYAPFGLCCDFVLRHHVENGVLEIVSTFSPI